MVMFLPKPTKHHHRLLISVGHWNGLTLIGCQYKCVISLFSAALIFLSPVTSAPTMRAGTVTVAIIHHLLICCFDSRAGWRVQGGSDKEALTGL